MKSFSNSVTARHVASTPKIALCLEYAIGQHGGTEVLVRELIDGLAGRYRIVLVSDDEPEFVLSAQSLHGKIENHFRWTPGSGALGGSRKLATDLHEQNIALAHFHLGGNFAWGARQLNLSPIIHLKRKGVPCLTTNHGVFGALDGFIGAHRSLLTKLLLLPAAWLGKMQVLAHVSAEVAVSQYDYRVLRRRYWPRRCRFRQIYHSRIHESEAIERRMRSRVILCAGTMGPRKGQPFLAHAFAEIASEFRDWKLMFIGRYGDPATAAEVESVMARLPQQIHWIQNCSDAELKQHLQSAEIFAMPSLHEGLGLSLQEALYFGCACVASRAEGILDLINHDENGILVPPGEPNPLAQALARLMTNAALRDRFRLAGHNSVLRKGMTAERMVTNYLNLYDEVLRECKPARP